MCYKYSSNQSPNSFRSHSTTPVSSPSLLTSVNQPQWKGPFNMYTHPSGVANTVNRSIVRKRSPKRRKIDVNEIEIDRADEIDELDYSN